MLVMLECFFADQLTVGCSNLQLNAVKLYRCYATLRPHSLLPTMTDLSPFAPLHPAVTLCVACQLESQPCRVVGWLVPVSRHMPSCQ